MIQVNSDKERKTIEPFAQFVAEKATLVKTYYDGEEQGTSVRMGKSHICYLTGAIESIYQAAVKELQGCIAYNPYEMMMEILKEVYYTHYTKEDRSLGDKGEKFLSELNSELSKHLKAYGFCDCKIELQDVTESSINVCRAILVEDVKRINTMRDLPKVTNFKAYFLSAGQPFIDYSDVMEGITNLYLLFLDDVSNKEFSKRRYKKEKIAEDVKPIAQATLQNFKQYNSELEITRESVEAMSNVYAKYIYDNIKDMLDIIRMKNLSKL